MDSAVDIAFDCLPLRCVGRMDSPLDASPAQRARYESLAAALEKHGPERTYFLYNSRCVFRMANSEVENMLRFEFEGIVRTDASDLLTESADLNVTLTSETCGELPVEVLDWFKHRVATAVAIEFDRFIAAGQLTQRTHELGQISQLADLTGFSGMNL